MAKCGQAVHRTVNRRGRLHLPRAEEADSSRISAMVRGRTLAFLAAFSGIGAPGLGQKRPFDLYIYTRARSSRAPLNMPLKRVFV